MPEYIPARRRNSSPLPRIYERAARHLRRLTDSQQVEHRRRQIGELAALAQRRPAAVTTSGTGFVVCAVCGLTPSSSSIRSAFPWSAVTIADAAELADTLDDPPEAPVGRLARLDHGRDRPGVPDHVRVREVDDAERVAVADLARRRGRRPRPPTSPACGRSSARRAGSGRGSGPRPATRSSRPPLKKYVTWAYFSVSATWSCFSPLLGEHLGERRTARPAPRTRPAFEIRRVARHRRQVERRCRAAASSAAVRGRGGS